MAANWLGARHHLAARLSDLAWSLHWLIERNRALGRFTNRPGAGACARHHAWRIGGGEAHQLLVLWDQDFPHADWHRALCADRFCTNRDARHGWRDSRAIF